MPDKIEAPMNMHVVARGAQGIMILNPPLTPMTDDAALGLAAWIVAISDGGREKFLKVLDAVEGT